MEVIWYGPRGLVFGVVDDTSAASSVLRRGASVGPLGIRHHPKGLRSRPLTCFFPLLILPTKTCPEQLGDIIVVIDNQDINTEADLFKILESHKPGDVISIRAQRYERLSCRRQPTPLPSTMAARPKMLDGEATHLRAAYLWSVFNLPRWHRPTPCQP